MAAEQDPPESDEDPTADTPDADSGDTADDAGDDGPIDWEARHKEAQKLISRQGAELALLRGDDADESDEDDEDDDDEEPDDDEDPAATRYQAESWDLATQTYGEQPVKAYRTFHRMFERAETPAEVMAALEAYRTRANGTGTGKPEAKPADAQAARDQALRPRVDSNRSDPGPDSDDEKIAEAVKTGNLDQFVNAAASRLGFGGRRGS